MTGTTSRSCVNGKIRVAERLGLNALGRVYNQKRTLTGRQSNGETS